MRYHHDQAVSKQALLTHLWPNLHVGLTSLSACIRLARQAVGDSGVTQHVIQMLHGRGYRFVASVEAREQAPPPDQRQPGRPPAEQVPVLEDAPTPSPAAAGTAANTSSSVLHTADGEYKLVTVLCCALAGAPTLVARMGPEVLYRRMQVVFGLVQEVLQDYEGTLLHQTSEGFTAVFGAPVAQEDHARRAVLAALTLRQRLGEQLTLSGQTPDGRFALCMGLHSGGLRVCRGSGHAPGAPSSGGSGSWRSCMSAWPLWWRGRARWSAWSESPAGARPGS
jgi:DNA-binding winged helix-turn-helix (wHTH) protein